MTHDDAEHRAHCGPARGFKICYCRCPLCRAPADEYGNRKDICDAAQEHPKRQHPHTGRDGKGADASEGS